jgi:hypothetical protein
MEKAKLIEKEIIGLERKFWEAMKNRDAKTMASLSDDTCILAGPQGVTKFQKKDFPQMVQQQGYELLGFKFQDDWQVSVLNDDLAVIAYKIHEDLNVDGQNISLTAADSSTWIRQGKSWVCSMHTEAICGDPFGRDRTRMM